MVCLSEDLVLNVTLSAPLSTLMTQDEMSLGQPEAPNGLVLSTSLPGVRRSKASWQSAGSSAPVALAGGPVVPGGSVADPRVLSQQMPHDSREIKSRRLQCF